MFDFVLCADIFLVFDKETLLCNLSEPAQNIDSKEQLVSKFPEKMSRESSFFVMLQAL